MNEKKKGLSTNQIILIAGLAVICAVIGICGFFIYQKLSVKPEEPAGAGSNLIIDEDNLAAVEDQLREEVEDGMFEVNMNTKWTFPDGETASTDAVVANGVSNNLPISFEILLDGTENIYTSTVIPVGKQIKEIKLDKDLEAGVYEAVCLYHLWKEDGTENSQFGVNIIITVQN